MARTANRPTGAEEMGSSTTSTLDQGYVSISEVCVAGVRSVPALGRAEMVRGMSRMKTTMSTSSTSVWVTTKSANGYQDFDVGHLERLDFIASTKRLGLELPEIRRLLELADNGTCTGVKATLQPLLAMQITTVEKQLQTLTDLQGQLLEAQAHVDACPDSDERCRSECAFRAFAGH